MTQKTPLFLQILALSLIAFMAVLVWVSPTLYDTDHLGDTLFIMGAGWRSYLGLTPTVDFSHFYGGVTAELMGLSMQLFGPTIKAYDYAIVLLLGMAILCLACISWKRLSLANAIIAACIIATLALTRHPLEIGQAITRSYATHSFLYNRIGLILLILVGLYSILPLRIRPAEIMAGLLAGSLLVALALSKPTFLILMPLAGAALLLQARWIGLASMGIGFIIALMLFDPWAARWLASYEYVQASVGNRADAQIVPLIRKVLMILFVQPLAFGMVALALVLVLIRPNRPWRLLFSMGLIGAAGLGMAATMGGGGSFGHLAVPILGIVLIALSQWANDRDSELGMTFAIMAIALAGSFIAPHAGNLVGTTLDSLSKRERTLITQGPYRGYLSFAQDEGGRTIASTQYEMFADGITALTEFGDMSDIGIIADNGISFEFALQARPVGTYPLWPRKHSPEFTDVSGLPEGASVVLIGRGAYQDSNIGPVLKSKLSADFPLCRSTPYWDIFVYKDVPCPPA